MLLALDLGVFHRKSHEISVREATIWSAMPADAIQRAASTESAPPASGLSTRPAA